jgi:hypothetical protein
MTYDVENKKFLLTLDKSKLESEVSTIEDLNTPVPLYYKIDVIFKGNVKLDSEDKTYDKEIFATIGVVVNPTKYNGTEEERVILQNEYNKLIRNWFYVHGKAGIFDEIDYTDDDELRKPIEIPDYLSGNVTYYYQNYMKEKLLKTELGNLKFSEYLEVVRPDLKELIEIERKREQRLDNIYKKYLKYRMALEDKTRVLSFREFAQYNYGLESYEIPEGYESSKKL